MNTHSVDNKLTFTSADFPNVFFFWIKVDKEIHLLFHPQTTFGHHGLAETLAAQTTIFNTEYVKKKNQAIQACRDAGHKHL